MTTLFTTLAASSFMALASSEALRAGAVAKLKHTSGRLVALLLALCALCSCDNYRNFTDFPTPEESQSDKFATAEALAEFEESVDPVFRLGAGDEIFVQVWGREELSGKHILGPDGVVTLPIFGPIRVADLTREEAARSINAALGKFYLKPSTTIRVDTYASNRIVVLGRVSNPGIVSFESPPTLLEALARAGGLPILEKQAILTRCAVIRGRDRIAWIDLRTLLSGRNLLLNIRLKSGDTVYIPDSDDTLVYVLGQVQSPGAYRLTAEMSFLDALAQAGGLTQDAAKGSIWLVRPSQNLKLKLSIGDFTAPTPGANVKLEEGDVIYVPTSGLASFGYVLNKLSPSLGFLLLYPSLAGGGL